MSEVKVNKITPTTNCGTVTLGDSGDTISIPSGASLSIGGTVSGIEGIVNWDTTAKTANFTAVSPNGYFVNTTSGPITVTLPATPTAGDLVAVKDYAFTADTNNITLARNGSNIQGQANDFIIDIEGRSVTLIYVDGTQGWLLTGASQKTDISPPFITATGGTITTCGDYKIHTFTGPGTFCVTCAGAGTPTSPSNVDYLVIAGGGGGGFDRGGGGGAGGTRESHCTATSGCYTASPLASATSLPISATAYPITVGAGGTAGTTPAGPSSALNGNNSVFSTITATAGGGGANANTPGCSPISERIGQPGGSGGGGTGSGACQGANAGSGNTPPVSPPQGNNGGPGYDGPSPSSGGGGGGAGSVAQGGAAPYGAGDGAIGITTSITGTAIKYAGGGGGGNSPPFGGSAGTGGIYPGGSPGPLPSRYGAGSGGPSAESASTNLGGGGGGGGCVASGGAGGSGIVIIRYKYQ